MVDAVSRLARTAADRIAAGALNGHGVGELAGELGVSERQLRRSLERELKVSPLELAQSHRLLLAARLLAETGMPVTRIAYASGFQSLRRFNAAFHQRYGLSPSRCRSTLRRSLMQGLKAVALAVAFAGTASAQNPSAPPADKLLKGMSAEVRAGFAKVRTVTAPFVSLDSAVAAGYARDVAQCYADQHHGAMGYHHINRSFVDAKAEVERPEILLYERHPDGRYALNGVEYIIPFRVWPKDSVPPTIMGETMKQELNLNLWYLHMWVWNENTAGLFADYNPAVKCPAP